MDLEVYLLSVVFFFFFFCFVLFYNLQSSLFSFFLVSLICFSFRFYLVSDCSPILFWLFFCFFHWIFCFIVSPLYGRFRSRVWCCVFLQGWWRTDKRSSCYRFFSIQWIRDFGKIPIWWEIMLHLFRVVLPHLHFQLWRFCFCYIQARFHIFKEVFPVTPLHPN